jgi:hypothetical protein
MTLAEILRDYPGEMARRPAPHGEKRARVASGAMVYECRNLGETSWHGSYESPADVLASDWTVLR